MGPPFQEGPAPYHAADRAPHFPKGGRLEPVAGVGLVHGKVSEEGAVQKPQPFLLFPRIPPGVGQCIRNDGEVDLVFYCVCSPAFEEARYEALE